MARMSGREVDRLVQLALQKVTGFRDPLPKICLQLALGAAAGLGKLAGELPEFFLGADIGTKQCLQGAHSPVEILHEVSSSVRSMTSARACSAAATIG